MALSKGAVAMAGLGVPWPRLLSTVTRSASTRLRAQSVAEAGETLRPLGPPANAAYQIMIGKDSADPAAREGFRRLFDYHQLGIGEAIGFVLAPIVAVSLRIRLAQGEKGLLEIFFFALKALAASLLAFAMHLELLRRPKRYNATEVRLPDSRLLPLRNGALVHCLVRNADSQGTGKDPDRLLHFSHGFGACSLSFAPLLAVLSSRLSGKVCLIAQDASGFGMSPRQSVTKWRSYSGQAQVGQALEVAEQLKPSAQAEETFFGHSMGSFTATEAVANRAPASSAKGPTKLVLIAPAIIARGTTKPKRRLVSWVSRVVTPVVALVQKVLFVAAVPFLYFFLWRLVGSEKFWSRGLSLSFATNQVDTGTLLRYRWQSLTKNWDTGMVLMLYARLFGQASVLDMMDGVVSRLAKLASEKKVDLLILHGTEDAVVPISNSRNLQKLVPGAKLVELKGAGHCPHEESAQKFAETIDSFLNSVSDSSASSPTRVVEWK